MRDGADTSETHELLTATAKAARDTVPVLQSLHGRIERALVTGMTGICKSDNALSELAAGVLDDLNSAVDSARSLQHELDALWRQCP